MQDRREEIMSKALLRTIPTMQALALASSTTKSFKTKKPKKKIKILKDLVKGTTRILVGVPLIKATATSVEGF
jgi:hypothetical protein